MSLEPMRDLVERLGNPHLGFRAIHVTGTKGKGSVSSLLEAALLKAGLSVGRYASPHLQRINERISLTRTPISDQKLSDCLTLALDAQEAARSADTPAGEATWFDLLTAAAFLAFMEARLSWVVLEVGLGGLNDSTNVVDGEIAVVTNVELEHTEVLGATRSAIAAEKVGILKPGARLVTTLPSTDEAGRVLQNRAHSLGCPSVLVPMYPGERIEAGNVRIAAAVLDCLGQEEFPTCSTVSRSPNRIGGWLLDESVRTSARLPGRLERFYVDGPHRRRLTVVMDGAHVPFNLEAVFRDLNEDADLTGPCVAVVGMGSDKDAPGLMKVLSRYASSIVFTELPGPFHGVRCDDLSGLAASAGIASEIRSTVSPAVERAMELASNESGWVLVTGSLHLVGAARSLPIFR